MNNKEIYKSDMMGVSKRSYFTIVEKEKRLYIEFYKDDILMFFVSLEKLNSVINEVNKVLEINKIDSDILELIKI